MKTFQPKAPPAIQPLSFHIKPNQITALAGPDGAGKTTLIRLMAGLLLPTKGHILVEGFDTGPQLDDVHQQIGYMPQKFGLYEDLSAIENLTLYADIKDVPLAKRAAIFDQLLTMTNLKPFQKRLAGSLSGGMKQKLGLACVLLTQPKVLLLDEPSVGVDPISRRELWQLVNHFVTTGTTVVWSTSYLDEAAQCQDVIVLNEGHCVYAGSPQELSKRIHGSVWRTKKPVADKRQVLQQLIQHSDLLDGLIQGNKLRVLAREKVNPNTFPESKKLKLDWEKVTPNFEDAFIYALGGIKERRSILEELEFADHDLKKQGIVAQNLTKKFGAFTAAQHITFDVKPGEIFGFLGPNGAGKSTTFKMLCGLLKPTHGTATLLGYDLKDVGVLARQHIGYMAQKFSLYGNLTVMHNLQFFAGIYGLESTRAQATIAQMITLFDLKTYVDTPAETLPLGFKQRLALACALMHQPSVLFLDEPTSGVDPLTRREFWLHINTMVQKGVTIMVTTHFMDEAEYCDRISLIYRGQLIALDTPDALKSRYQTEADTMPTLEETFIRLIQDFDQKHHPDEERQYDV